MAGIFVLTMAKKISIQGFEGSFHQEAALNFFGKDVSVICCSTFREVVKIAASKKDADGAVMAIENSIAGSILANYSLLQKNKLKIVGEVYLQIKQHLLVNPSITFENIREVHSHPMALLQCMDYLDKQHWRLIETEDTALSAKHVHQHKSKHIAAVAGKLAAELYGLKIIVPNIHTQKKNYTRFLVLQREDIALAVADANKASINFVTNHTRGSLAKVLGKIADGGINLSKLQSMPIPGSNFSYSFHADLEFKSKEQFDKVMKNVTSLTNEITIFGVYKNGNQ
jgi:prephenate dehydratase